MVLDDDVSQPFAKVQVERTSEFSAADSGAANPAKN